MPSRYYSSDSAQTSAASTPDRDLGPAEQSPPVGAVSVSGEEATLDDDAFQPASTPDTIVGPDGPLPEPIIIDDDVPSSDVVDLLHTSDNPSLPLAAQLCEPDALAQSASPPAAPAAVDTAAAPMTALFNIDDAHAALVLLQQQKKRKRPRTRQPSIRKKKQPKLQEEQVLAARVDVVTKRDTVVHSSLERSSFPPPPLDRFMAVRTKEIKPRRSRARAGSKIISIPLSTTGQLPIVPKSECREVTRPQANEYRPKAVPRRLSPLPPALKREPSTTPLTTAQLLPPSMPQQSPQLDVVMYTQAMPPPPLRRSRAHSGAARPPFPLAAAPLKPKLELPSTPAPPPQTSSTRPSQALNMTSAAAVPPPARRTKSPTRQAAPIREQGNAAASTQMWPTPPPPTAVDVKADTKRPALDRTKPTLPPFSYISAISPTHSPPPLLPAALPKIIDLRAWASSPPPEPSMTSSASTQPPRSYAASTVSTAPARELLRPSATPPPPSTTLATSTTVAAPQAHSPYSPAPLQPRAPTHSPAQSPPSLTVRRLASSPSPASTPPPPPPPAPAQAPTPARRHHAQVLPALPPAPLLGADTLSLPPLLAQRQAARMVLPSLQAVQEQQQQSHGGPGRPSRAVSGRALSGSGGKVRLPSRLARSTSSPSSSSSSSSSSASSSLPSSPARSPSGKSASRQQPSRLRQVQSLSPPSQYQQPHERHHEQRHEQQPQPRQRPVAISKHAPPSPPQLPSLSSLVASLPQSLPPSSHFALQHVP